MRVSLITEAKTVVGNILPVYLKEHSIALKKPQKITGRCFKENTKHD